MSQSAGWKVTSDGSGVHPTSSSPANGYPNNDADDLLKLLFKNHTYILYFEPYAISDGKVLISDVKEGASEKLNVNPRRVRLSYKGKHLNDYRRTARAYNIKHNSEIVCVTVDDDPEDAAGGGAFDDWLRFRRRASKEPQQTSGVPQSGFPGMAQTATTTTRRRAGFDPNTPGRDEPMAPRMSASVRHAQRPRSEFLDKDTPQSPSTARRGPVSKPGLIGSTGPITKPGRVGSTGPIRKPGPTGFDSGEDDVQSTKGQGGNKAPDGYEPNLNKPRVQEFQTTTFSAEDWAGKFDDLTWAPGFPQSDAPETRSPRMDGVELPSLRDTLAGLEQPAKFSAGEWADKFKGQTWASVSPQSEVSKTRSPGVDGVELPAARDKLALPEQSARPRSAPVTDFHSKATKAFQEDVYVWSSVIREFTATLASVDTQSDRNLVYLGFLENDLQLEYKKYNDGVATPLRTLAGNVWPLGWVMLKIFPLKVNPKSGILERHRPQYVVFDVYEMTTFGDMLLGNEYAEGNDICNFLIKGSRKTTAQTEALQRQREEEFRRFEADNVQQTQNGQGKTFTDASMNSSTNPSAQQT